MMKKSQANSNPPTKPASYIPSTFSPDMAAKLSYFQPTAPSSFGSSVIGFISSFNGGVPQNALSFSGSINKQLTSSQLNPFNLTNAFGLPDFNERGGPNGSGFPSFFLAGNKSGSFEISPHSSFVNYNKSGNNNNGGTNNNGNGNSGNGNTQNGKNE